MHACTPERLFRAENVKPHMPLRFERASDEEPEIRCDCGTRLKLGRLPWQSRCLRCKQPWKARHLWRYHTEVLGLVGRLPWNCHLKYNLRIIAEPELPELPPKVPVSWSEEKLPAGPKRRPPLRMTRSDPSAEEPAPEEGPTCDEVSEEPSSCMRRRPRASVWILSGISQIGSSRAHFGVLSARTPPMCQEALDLEKDSRSSEPSVEDAQMGLDVEEELKRPLKRLKNL